MTAPNIREIVEQTLKNLQQTDKGRNKYSFTDTEGQRMADACVPLIETLVTAAIIDIIEGELDKLLAPYLTAKAKGLK